MKFLQNMTYLKWLIFIYVAIILFILPWEHIFSLEPATGGDVGSHFYPLYAILKSYSIRPWNPGNLGGEPLLVHYFPFPFMLMSFFSLFLSKGLVFNWLYLLPVFALPFCVYYFLKKSKAPSYSPEFGFIFSILFIFNTSYFAWGGNIFSLLSGQFNHSYALCFLFLWMGVTYQNLEEKKIISLRSSFLIAAIILSHAYIALSLPVVSAVILLISVSRNYLESIKKIISNAFIGLGLTIWWIVPFLTNSMWTTPYGDKWLTHLNDESYLPKMFIFFLLIGILAIISVLSNDKMRKHLFRSGLTHLVGLIVIAFFYFILIEIFPLVGLVDIRAIPQVQLFIGLSFSIILGIFVNALPVKNKHFVFFTFVVLSIFFIREDISKVQKRMVWNWSGWHSKPGHKDFMKINESLKGNFSMPRVAFEHNQVNRMAGTLRAFEMLPYFSGRSTTEGLYMQATAYSPLAFYFQSLIGKQRSCPFPNFPCGNLNLKKASELMPILGIQELILSSKESLNAIKDHSDKFQFITSSGPWNVFKLKNEVSLVEVISNISSLPEGFNWKKSGVNDVLERPNNNSWSFVPQFTDKIIQDKLLRGHYLNAESCKANLIVDFNKIHLKTDCPGYPHVIKFSFHPSFKTNNGDPIFLMLPNYIGIIPSEKEITLEFGQSWDWKISRIISISVLIMILLYLILRCRKKRS
jgi:hypothetical protein